MAASISIFSSKVQILMAEIAALWVSRRRVRGMSQKTCCGPRLMLLAASVISSMLAMAGLSAMKGTQMDDRLGQQTVVLIKDYDRDVFLLFKKCNTGLFIHVIHLMQAFTDGEQ